MFRNRNVCDKMTRHGKYTYLLLPFEIFNFIFSASSITVQPIKRDGLTNHKLQLCSSLLVLAVAAATLVAVLAVVVELTEVTVVVAAVVGRVWTAVSSKFT